jgi:hypothetical protein
MMLRKFSKTVKGLVEEETVTPWSLKGQIDFNLTPVNLNLYSLKAISSMTPTIS